MILPRQLACALLYLLAFLLLSCDNSSSTEGSSSSGPTIEQLSVVGSRTGMFWPYDTDLELEGQVKAQGLKTLIVDLYDGEGNLVASKLYDSLPRDAGGLTFGPATTLRVMVTKDKWRTGKPSLRLTAEDAQGRTISKTLQIQALQYSGGPPPRIVAFAPVGFDATRDIWKIGDQLQFSARCEAELGLASVVLEIRDSIGRAVTSTSPLLLSGFSAEFGPGTGKLLSLKNPGTWKNGRYRAMLILKDRLGSVIRDSLSLYVDGSSFIPPEILQFESANFDESLDLWGAGMVIEFYGQVTDESNLSQLKLEFIDAAGKATLIKAVAVSGTSVKFGINEAVKFQVANPGTWGPTGSYKIRLTATDNDGLTSSKDLTFKEIAGTGSSSATLTESSISLGGAGSALPSFLDVDAMAALTVAAAKAAQASVDLRFNNTTDSKNEVRSPSEDASLNWTVRNATKFHKVAAGSYAATTTAAAVTALFDATKGQSTQLILAEGDELVVKSVENNVRIIKVSITKNTGASTVEFSVKGKK